VCETDNLKQGLPIKKDSSIISLSPYLDEQGILSRWTVPRSLRHNTQVLMSVEMSLLVPMIQKPFERISPSVIFLPWWKVFSWKCLISNVATSKGEELIMQRMAFVQGIKIFWSIRGNTDLSTKTDSGGVFQVWNWQSQTQVLMSVEMSLLVPMIQKPFERISPSVIFLPWWKVFSWKCLISNVATWPFGTMIGFVEASPSSDSGGVF
jgi:hypothetical protein